MTRRPNVVVDNPYLSGNFRPVREEVTVSDLAVTGAIPPELDGRYLRNGPNPVTDPDPATYNWFTGTGMVHGIRLRDGRAEWYRNRYPRAGDVPAALGLDDPGGAAPHGGFDFSPNTNVIGHGGRYYALVEAGALPVELDGDLATVGRSDFQATLPNGYAAHPHLDPSTGELHAICYWWGFGNQVQYVVVGADGRVSKTLMLPTSASPMLHDCAITENHIAVFDLPVAFDATLAATGSAFPYRWFDDASARVGFLPLAAATAAELRWFDVEPCYVYHPLNAYEQDDRIVLDVVRHRDTLRDARLNPGAEPPSLWRWTFDLRSGGVSEHQITDDSIEFPRLDERFTGRRHRYGYAPAYANSAGLQDTRTLRFDLDAGVVTAHDHGRGRHPGEFVFVPGESAAEGNGYLMGLVHDDATDTSDLVVLAADALEESPIATVHLPVRVPYGLHGNWIATPG